MEAFQGPVLQEHDRPETNAMVHSLPGHPTSPTHGYIVYHSVIRADLVHILDRSTEV